MMNRPPINELIEKTGCRYRLVSAASKRAKKIIAEVGEHNSADNVAMEAAISEIYSDQVEIVYTDKHSS